VSGVAIITGGARGIGAACGRWLASDGLAIGIVDLDPSAAGDTVAAVRAQGVGVCAAEADVGDAASMEDAVARVAAELGAPTVLVNNAGITRPGAVHKLDPDDWALVNRIVLQGAFHATRAVAPYFREADGAARRVINIASVAGTFGAPASSAYAAAKAGIVGFTRSLAFEWARFGVTVNAVAPGFIETDMTAGFPAQARERIVARVPLGRVGTPDDVAAAVAFFASAASGYITGQVLEVHGGLADVAGATA
jgi:3-oxoacyl-[acyl-carrier protein] reductase